MYADISGSTNGGSGRVRERDIILLHSEPQTQPDEAAIIAIKHLSDQIKSVVNVCCIYLSIGWCTRVIVQGFGMFVVWCTIARQYTTIGNSGTIIMWFRLCNA